MSFLRICIVLSSLTCVVAAGSRSVRDGVYTKAQALRGQTVYREECAKCHAENLAGGESAPALAGDEFAAQWQGKTANDLFEITRKTMPADDPGRLSRRQYADLVAYMLSANEYPAGGKELESTAEALQDIRIEAKK
jgi:mono/diheme cytochrome c family protein